MENGTERRTRRGRGDRRQQRLVAGREGRAWTPDAGHEAESARLRRTAALTGEGRDNCRLGGGRHAEARGPAPGSRAARADAAAAGGGHRGGGRPCFAGCGPARAAGRQLGQRRRPLPVPARGPQGPRPDGGTAGRGRRRVKAGWEKRGRQKPRAAGRNVTDQELRWLPVPAAGSSRDNNGQDARRRRPAACPRQHARTPATSAAKAARDVAGKKRARG